MEIKSVTCRLRFFLASLLPLIGIMNAGAQNPIRTHPISVGQTIVSTLTGRETDVYTLNLNQGETAIFRTTELGTKGVNIQSKWDSIYFAKDDIDKWGQQTLLILNTGVAASHHITITADGQQQASGKYAIRFVGVRRAEKQDVLDLMANVLYGYTIETAKYDNQDSLKKAWSALYDIVPGVRDSLIRANTLRFVGEAFAGSHRQEDGRTYLNAALKLYTGLGDRHAEALCLHDLGDVSYRLGDKGEHIRLELLAAAIYKALGDSHREADAYNNIGLSYSVLEDKDNARIYYSRAIRTIPDRKSPLAGTIYNNIALEFANKGASDSAIFYYKKAVLLRHDKYSSGGKAQSLANMAIDYAKTKHYALAIASINQAIAIADSAKDIEGSIFYRSRLGSTYYIYLHNKAKAKEILNHALSLTTDNSSSTGEAHHQLAHIEVDDKNWRTALYHLNYLTDERDALWGMNMSSGSALEYGEGRLHPYYLKITCFMELYKESHNANYTDSACAVAMDIKGRSFAYEHLISENYGEKIKQNPVLGKLADTISYVYLFQPARKNKADTYMKLLEAYHSALLNACAAEPVLPAKHMQSVAPDNSVEFLMHDTESYAWVRVRDSIYTYYLPARAVFDTTIKKINAGIQLYYTLSGAPRAKARQIVLNEIGTISGYLRPVLQKLNKGKVFVCRDGALSLIPFQLLNMNSGVPGYTPAVTAFEFSYLPSFRFYDQAGAENPAGDQDSLLVVADPVFSYRDTRIQYHAGDYKKPNLQLERLVNSSAESQKISRYFSHATTLTGPNAGKESLLRRPLSAYAYIHFATHSVYDANIPDLGTLVMSYADSGGHVLNPLLFAFEIQNLHLKAKLVVMSSCYSGFGKAYTTEGVLSLERAFLVAGASFVIAANWSVPDQFSADFFSQFYSYHKNEGLPISKALRQTQLDLWNVDHEASVLDWAAFTCSGTSK